MGSAIAHVASAGLLVVLSTREKLHTLLQSSRFTAAIGIMIFINTILVARPEPRHRLQVSLVTACCALYRQQIVVELCAQDRHVSLSSRFVAPERGNTGCRTSATSRSIRAWADCCLEWSCGRADVRPSSTGQRRLREAWRAKLTKVLNNLLDGRIILRPRRE